MWVNLWSTCLCWRSSGAIGVLHSAGSHLVRPRQQQLVGLISPARAVLRSSLHKLLQTAAAVLDQDLQRTTVSSADWRSGTESMLAFNQISVIKLSAGLLLRWWTFSRVSQHPFFWKWRGNIIMRSRRKLADKSHPEAPAAHAQFRTCRK